MAIRSTPRHFIAWLNENGRTWPIYVESVADSSNLVMVRIACGVTGGPLEFAFPGGLYGDSTKHVLVGGEQRNWCWAKFVLDPLETTFVEGPDKRAVVETLLRSGFQRLADGQFAADKRELLERTGHHRPAAGLSPSTKATREKGEEASPASPIVIGLAVSAATLAWKWYRSRAKHAGTDSDA